MPRSVRLLGITVLLSTIAACGGGGGDAAAPAPAPAPTPSVTLAVAPGSATIIAGQATSTVATIVRGGGFPGEVVIAGSSAPVGVSVTGGTIAAGATTQTVTINSTTSTAAGTYSLSITGTAPGVVISPQAFTLTVQPPPPDFDGDGLPDATDPDDDNDGALDTVDLFPLDPARTRAIPAAFPKAGNVFQLPDYPSTRALDWLLAQLAAGDTTEQQISARFTPEFLNTVSAAQVRQFLQTLRSRSPNAIVVDLVTATPISVTALIGTPGSDATGQFLNLQTRYGTGLISQLSATVFPLNGTVQSVADRSLSMAQALDRFQTLAPATSFLVARVQGRQCTPLEQRNGTTQRATGSIFKHYVLGALAQGIRDGAIATSTSIPRIAAETVAGSPLSSEPPGTNFTLQDMATLMMGNSDNTATDHLHELVGRTRLEAGLTRFGHASPERMTPFLSVNEQFQLVAGTVSPTDALAYVDGTESFQRTYLENTLRNLPPWTGGNPAADLLIRGTWQASPLDVCAVLAGMLAYNDASPEFAVIDRALSSSVAQPAVRGEWERVWYKGGSLATAQNSLVVLTHSWLLQSDSRGTYVVVAMAADPGAAIDQFQVQSITSRILQLVDQTY